MKNVIYREKSNKLQILDLLDLRSTLPAENQSTSPSPSIELVFGYSSMV